jgi:polysaccharide pyruvyl transferase WcaK-like protein
MGDHIIVDSIKRHLREIVPDAIFVTVPTHEYLGPESFKLLDSSEVRLVCGTNLLASHMDQYKQWKLGGLEFAALRELTLLGCGWWQYQEAPNAYTELLLNRILSGKTVHSVRDGYTLAKLSGLNGKSVVNTTCPTLWSLTPQHLKSIPDRKGLDVVTTLTDYKADPAADRFLLEHLSARYRNVYVWIQGTGDFTYLKKLASDLPKVRVVAATLEAYDRLLSSSLDLDYVGTRLHAGVRALQKKRRALILAVDNRAREISSDTALPCIPRENAMRDLEGLVDRFSARDIRLPVAAINRFIGQFAAAAR